MDGLVMKYFVLKPHGDDVYAEASRTAMKSYAYAIKRENPTLASNLFSWVDRETFMQKAEDRQIRYNNESFEEACRVVEQALLDAGEPQAVAVIRSLVKTEKDPAIRLLMEHHGWNDVMAQLVVEQVRKADSNGRD